MTKELKKLIDYITSREVEKQKYLNKINDKKQNIKISNLRMQKVLYFVYGLYYNQTKKELFKDEFEKWPYGPVVKDAYCYIKEFNAKGKIEIDKKIENDEVLNNIMDLLDSYSTYKLVSLSHVSSPWTSTKDNEIICKNKIQDFFQQQI